MHGSLSMFEIPIIALLVVTVIYERWLIATIREAIAVGRNRKGFINQRLTRRIMIGFLVVCGVFLAIIGCFLILAIIRLW